MFVALQQNNEDSNFSPLKNMLGPSIQLQKVKIQNNAPFYVVTIPKGRRIPWKKLRTNLGRLCNKVLLPKDIIIPENSGVKAIAITDQLHAVSLLNTANLVAKQSKISVSKLKITIVDRDGIYLDNIEKIINCASHIRVITNNYKKYEPVVENIFDYWGASIFLSDDIQMALNSNIIISPFEQVIGTNALVMSLDKCDNLTCNTAIATRLLLPNELIEYLPKGIDEHDFASVLYDEYKLKCLSNISLDKMIVNGCEKSVYEMAKLMDSQLCFT